MYTVHCKCTCIKITVFQNYVNCYRSWSISKHTFLCSPTEHFLHVFFVFFLQTAHRSCLSEIPSLWLIPSNRMSVGTFDVKKLNLCFFFSGFGPLSKWQDANSRRNSKRSIFLPLESCLWRIHEFCTTKSSVHANKGQYHFLFRILGDVLIAAVDSSNGSVIAFHNLWLAHLYTLLCFPVLSCCLWERIRITHVGSHQNTLCVLPTRHCYSMFTVDNLFVWASSLLLHFLRINGTIV